VIIENVAKIYLQQLQSLTFLYCFPKIRFLVRELKIHT